MWFESIPSVQLFEVEILNYVFVQIESQKKKRRCGKFSSWTIILSCIAWDLKWSYLLILLVSHCFIQSLNSELCILYRLTVKRSSWVHLWRWKTPSMRPIYSCKKKWTLCKCKTTLLSLPWVSNRGIHKTFSEAYYCENVKFLSLGRWTGCSRRTQSSFEDSVLRRKLSATATGNWISVHQSVRP